VFKTLSICGVFIMALSSFPRSSHAADLPAPALELAADKTAKPGQTHTAIFAGGCFWCIEGVFQQLQGVEKVVSGYAGGTKATANYEMVCTASTGHAEAVKITYDPAKTSYAKLLRVFFTLHDPTTKNRQGPDSGPQYRSAIFFEDEDQKKVAETYIKQLDATKIFPQPIVTTLEPLKADAFYPAEDYHQNYVVCHLRNPYVMQEALPKIDKVREKFKDEVKPATMPAQ
jgi:peptide-methionine (S)-S-oxide reductase